MSKIHLDYLGHSYDKVGTLCDDPAGLTCSFDAVKRWGKARIIEPYNTFEEAATAVKNDEISAFIVPCAYPRLSYFIMDPDLVTHETFIIRIPSLIVVGKEPDMPSAVDVIFHHPATTPLLSEIPFDFQRDKDVTSNSKACVELLNATSQAAAITNELCATFYQLKTYKVLRPGIMMPFACFIKAQE